MKLISMELGRAAQGFVGDEIRPLSGLNLPEFIRLIQDRYGFVRASDIKDVGQTGAKFQQGRLTIGNKTINITELAVFSDGIVVTSFQTDDAEFILKDLFDWSKGVFGFREPETEKPRIFESHIVVEFDRPIDPAMRAFDGVRQQIAKSVEDTYGIKTQIGYQRVDLSAPMKPQLEIGRPSLAIERRINYPFEANRFFSTSSFRTERHLELLQAFENAIPKPATT
jgi:hypothetical protein